MVKNQHFAIYFSHCPLIGSARLKKIEAYFHDFKLAFEAGEYDLIKSGLDPKVVSGFTSFRQKVNFDRIDQKIKDEKITVLFQNDENYPKILKEIYDPPYLIYTRGEFNSNDDLAVAIVGTRRMTDYGRRVTEEIVTDLCQNKITIVSGLALGIDSIAHKTALKYGGRTVAVLAGGIDQASIFPSINGLMAQTIAEGRGVVISEQPPGTASHRYLFPIRNRIIAGLSLGVVVIEAAEKSGALITSRCAIDYNREVFAVPGSIFSPASIGPNNLIKVGAQLVTSAGDILQSLKLENEVKIKQQDGNIDLNQDEKNILEILDLEKPMNIDKIVKVIGQPLNNISSRLTLLEIRGLIRNTGGANFVKLIR